MKPTLEVEPKTHQFRWRYQQRITTEHLGVRKYTTSTRAIGELVANGLDAGATRVTVELRESELGNADSIIVTDNGSGICLDEFKRRFMVVGIEANQSERTGVNFGQLGVGRFAVYRIGTVSRWITISKTNTQATRLTFTLRDAAAKNLELIEDTVAADTPTGTTIEIFNLVDSGKDRLTATRIANDLLGQYCSYLLGHQTQQIIVQGETLNLNSLIASRTEERLVDPETVFGEAALTHLLLTRTVDQSRFPKQVLFSAKGRTVASIQPEIPPGPNYIGLIECPYLDSIVTSNRELLIEMDGAFARLRETVLAQVDAYRQRLTEEHARTFIERARMQEFYPYRNVAPDAITGVEQAIYDVVLEKANENANIEGMTRRQQEIVFRLLKRALDNENVLEVLAEIAKLSDDDMERFRKVLEQTTLESIIKLSSEVTNRLTFLDVLHELVYGDLAKTLKERRQLHKILDPHCWLFGSKYHLATSDKSFRAIINKHRTAAGLGPVQDDVLGAIEGINDIPDLFLAATREFPIEPRCHHLLVELKAPRVSLGSTELAQVRRYAQTILDSHEFDKNSTTWDIYLISSKVNAEIELDRNQKDKPFGCTHEWPRMRLWAFEWNEIISAAKAEMLLVRQQLQRKSRELTVSGYLKEHFPHILADLSTAKAQG